MMSDKCEHNSGTVLHEFPRFSIIKCDWGCGEYLIEIKLGNNTVRTYTADDIFNRDAELEELRERLDKMVREQSEEVAEFNAGYDAFGAGMELDSAESEYRSSVSAKSYDVFKIGYLYASANALKFCPSCTWRGDVELNNGVCPQCDTDWKAFQKGKK